MIAAVIDLNIIISATIISRGAPFEVWSAWRSEQFTLLSSEGMLSELAEKLLESKIAKSYGIGEEERQALLLLLRSQATLIAVPAEQQRTVTGVRNGAGLSTAQNRGAAPS